MKPSLLVILCFLLAAPLGHAASSVDLELKDVLQKKDWPGVILLLQPLQGQNFEHDLVLAKALLSLERRSESLKILAALYEKHKEDRVFQLFQAAGTLFFSQDTSNRYYDGFQLLIGGKWAEAKEQFELGLSKEPDQILLLARLTQIEILLGLKESAQKHLKLAQAGSPVFPELKLMAAKLMLDTPLAEGGSEEDLYRALLPLKSAFLENQIAITWWAEALKRAKKKAELDGVLSKLMKTHPLWTYAQVWFYKNAELTPKLRDQLKIQIDRGLKDKNEFNSRTEAFIKAGQYYWAGYINYDSLLNQLN